MDFLTTCAAAFKANLPLFFVKSNLIFLSLFLFRYTKFVVSLFAYYFVYRPSPVMETPWLTEKDCTVVIPTCAPEDPAFQSCVESLVRSMPKVIHIVTVGAEQEKRAWSVIGPFIRAFSNIQFTVSNSPVANKRGQVAVALSTVKTAITVLCDDHVVWPSSKFLLSAIAPFQDPNIGAVGTKKRVTRHENTTLWEGFWNVIGALYLERHNLEITAANAIDGGVPVISGRTCLYRTQILQDPEVLHGYLNEMFFFGLYGPLSVDDDNYLTRTLVKRGWKIKFQNTNDAMIVCDVGEYPKFLSQCLRWSRTTFRSNTCSLITDRSIYFAHPFTVYSMMISQMVNFAAIWDPVLIWTLTRTDFYSTRNLMVLILWIIFSKLPKIMTYFWRQPRDLIYLPAYYCFSYFHSLIKLWSLMTFWDVQWSGRNLNSINAAAAENPDAPDDGDDNGVHHHHHHHQNGRLSRRGSCHHQSSSSRQVYGSVSTPYGFVKAVNLQRTPANVLQGQTRRSWPVNWTYRRRDNLQQHGYIGEDSPRALEFEDGLAVQDYYPTPVSISVTSGYQRYVTPPQRGYERSRHLTPPDSHVQPRPLPVLATPSRTPQMPNRSWVRAGPCGRIHEGYYPMRRCVL